MPPLYPENSINTLGLATNPWDALFVDHLYLTSGEGPSTVNGALWLGTNNDILARTGGVTKNLSDIGSSPTLTSGPGILVAGNIIALDSDDMPELQPSAAINSLGSTAKPWDGVYVDHLKLTPNESVSNVNGVMWQDSNGDIQVRTGGVTKSLSDIGSGGDIVTLVAGPGILVAGYIITLDSDDMPELQPANSANSLGSTAKPWDSLYTDHVRLTANEAASNANGVIWQDSNGDIRARTGGSTKNLSDISTGTITLTGGNGILVSGYTIILDNDDMPPLYPENSGNTLGLLSNPWDSLYVDHVRLTANEAASNINGVMWQDSNGDIQARSGGITRNLSDIGSSSSGVTISQVNTAITNHASNANAHHTPASDITLTSGPGILVSGYVIALDSDDMPPLYPANSANSLGISSNPWDALHVDHIYLHPNEAAVNTNGVIWQDSSGNIQARSGGSTVSLSDIGSGGGDITLVAGAGISVSGYTISLNGSNVPTLLPASNANDLGATFRPWDRLYVDHIYLHSAEAALTVNGTIWQDASGNIQARSGGTTRSLSDIGSGDSGITIAQVTAAITTHAANINAHHTPDSGTVTLTGSHGILVSGPSPYIIILDSDDMPPLSPENSINGLGLSSNPWDRLYVDHIYLHVGEAASSVNGAMWQDSSGNIMARTGGVTQNLSAIGTSNGGSITLVSGAGITVSGYTISIDSNNVPPLYPANSINALGFEDNSWSRLYVYYLYLHVDGTTPFINGTMWQDSSGDIRAYSGGAVRNLSDIGSGSGTTVTGGVGISILGTVVTIDGSDLPTLRPRSSDQNLGTSTYPWDRLYVDHLLLTANESVFDTNGVVWQDSDGNIRAYSGGVNRNLSDIGLSGGNFDGNNLPTLRPSSSGNDLGISSDPWDSLYVDHVYLHVGEGSSNTNGALWQDSSGDIQARSGGVTRNLSDIGSGSGSITLIGSTGIFVSDYNIAIDGSDMPSLHPRGLSDRLGDPNAPWDSLFVDHIVLHEGESSSIIDGTMWQDNSGNVQVRSGGITRNLSDVGPEAINLNITGGIGITISGLTDGVIAVDGTDMPTLSPRGSSFDLGTTSSYWDALYVDHIYLHANEAASTVNGTMWLSTDNHIYVRTGGFSKNLSDIDTGGGVAPIGGVGILVSGYNISLDSNDIPNLLPRLATSVLGNFDRFWEGSICRLHLPTCK